MYRIFQSGLVRARKGKMASITVAVCSREEATWTRYQKEVAEWQIKAGWCDMDTVNEILGL